MPKDSKQPNLFFKKSVTGHLGGSHSSDHSENSRTSTPTASEDEGSRPSRSNTDHKGDHKPQVTEHRVEHKPPKQPVNDLSIEPATDESSSSTNVSTPTSTTSSDRDSTRSRDSNSSPAHSKSNKRPMRKKEIGRGSYSSHRGSYRGKMDRRDVGRMNYFRAPGPRAPMFHHRPPPPPPHYFEHLSQSPREHAPFIVPVSSPRRTPRHSESSSCGSPLQSGMHYPSQTPPHSPQHYVFDSPVSSPLRHHMSPYNSPPRRSPAPRMVHPEMMHPGMMQPQHPMMQAQRMAAFPIPHAPHEMRHFAGTPPPQFVGNPPMMMVEQMQPMRPLALTPEQQHMMQSMAMQQKAAAEQQMEMQLRKQQEMQHMNFQMRQLAMQGQNVSTGMPEQFQQIYQYTHQNMNMPQNVIQQEMLQHNANMMLNQQNLHPIPPFNPELQQQFFQNNPMSQQMSQQMHPVSLHHQLALMNQHNMGQSPNQQNQFQAALGPNQHIMVPQPIHPDPNFMNHPMGSPQNSPSHRHNMNILAQSHNIEGRLHNVPAQHQSTMAMVQPQGIIVQPQNSPVQTQMFLAQSQNTQIARSQNIPIQSPNLPEEPPKNLAQSVSPNIPVSREEQLATPQPPEEVEPSERNKSPATEAVTVDNNMTSGSPAAATDTATIAQLSQQPPTTTASSTVPDLVTPVKKPPKTPGLIRLPPQLPTEEELMKSPEPGGTPVALKKNYWQKRQKSTTSSETIKESADVSKNLPTEKEIVNPSVPEVPDKKDVVVKEDVPPKESTSTTVTQDARKSKIKSKAFNLSDLGELVSNTVKHNSTIPKTDISTGSVEVVMNQGFRKSQPSAPSTSSGRTDVRMKSHDDRKVDGDTWRPLSREQKATTEVNWRSASKPEDQDRQGKSRSSIEDRQGKSRSSSTSNPDDSSSRVQALKEAETKDLSTGQQIQYALEKLQSTSPAPRTMSESSSKSTKEDLPDEPWYDENDEDEIDCFDLTI